VEVFSEEILTGTRKLTSRAYVTFVSIDAQGEPQPVPPLVTETPEDEERCRRAHARRAERLARKNARRT
jgi:acyl-CoA hydrolase